MGQVVGLGDQIYSSGIWWKLKELRRWRGGEKRERERERIYIEL